MVLLASPYLEVFTVFAVFWVAVIAVLFIGVGGLLKRRRRLQAKHAHGAPPASRERT
jgi:hypothetical protein